MTESGEVIVYRSPDGKALVQLRPVAGTVWLTQAQIAELYDTSIQNIGQIIRRVLEDGEVTEATTNSEFKVHTEGARGVRREIKIYNLDMVLADKVRELFAASSADYDGSSETAKTFFVTIQNKLIFAVTGRTAAELVLDRADPQMPKMGLVTWKGDRVHKSDAVVASSPDRAASPPPG